MGNSNSAFNSINQGFPMVTLDNIALEGDDCCQRARLRPRDLAWEEVFPSACSTCTNAACQFLRLRGNKITHQEGGHSPVPNSCMQGAGGASSNLPPAQYKSRAHTSPEALRPNAATCSRRYQRRNQGGYHLTQRPSPIPIISTESHSFSIWIL